LLPRWGRRQRYEGDKGVKREIITHVDLNWTRPLDYSVLNATDSVRDFRLTQRMICDVSKDVVISSLGNKKVKKNHPPNDTALDSFTLEQGIDRLCRNVGKKVSINVAQNPQKSKADLIYTTGGTMTLLQFGNKI